jgi:xylulokinase
MSGTGPLLAGIDAGTSRVRTLIFGLDGTLMGEGWAKTPIEQLGGTDAQFDPEALWRAAVSASRQAVAQIDDPARIRGLAVASVGESGIALDGSGQPVAKSLAWYDQRPRQVAAELGERHDAHALHMASGMWLHPIAGLCKMLWMRQQAPDAFARARHWLNVADYLAFKLSGEMATDCTLAGRMLCFEMDSGGWNAPLLSDLGIDPTILPPVFDNGAKLGSVSAEAAEATGLSTDCVVAVGGHDHIVGAMAAGVFATGALLDSIGTAEALLLPIPRRTRDPNFVNWSLEQAALRLDGQAHFYICGGLATSTASIEWFRRLFAADLDYGEMMEEAAGVAAGAEDVLFVPHMRIGSPPDCYPEPSGAFLRLSTDIERPVLYRAVLEGLAFDTRNIRDHMMALLPEAERADALKRPAIVIGGGAQNSLLLEIKADVYDAPLWVLKSKEAVSHGVAMLGGLASGEYADIAQATASVQISNEQRRPWPDTVALYERIYTKGYLAAIDALRQVRR